MPTELEDGSGGNAMEGEGDVGPEEGIAPGITPSPGMPTARERAIHGITHIPYISWCDDCVRGRGRDRHHKLCGAYGRSTVSKVHLDYCFFKETASRSEEPIGDDANDERREEGKQKEGKLQLMTLVMKETGCGSVWAYPVRHKGAVQEPWVAKQIVHDLDTCGLKEERIGLKSDQEAAITALWG